ncbi:MAG: type II secretion system protein GspG [Verrucomicrobiales bacterium]
MQSSNKRSVKGFTLIEMLVVVAIIAVLSGITVGGFALVSRQQDLKKAKLQIELLQLKLEDYKLENGDYPESLSAVGEGQTQVIYKALFPIEEDAKIYLDQLDPDNDTQGWLGRQEAEDNVGEGLVIYDPWGNEYYYRTSPNSANPDFDLWSAGPDGETLASGGGGYDNDADENLDDVRGW